MSTPQAELPAGGAELDRSSLQAQSRCVPEWMNGAATPFPQHKLIHELFEERAAAAPDAVALNFEGRCLTYAELNRQANGVAAALLARGLQPGDRVGLLAERSMAMVAAMLGVLKAGGAYVPLDPHYPAERLTFMVEDSAPVAVLAQSAVRAQAALPGVQILDLPEWSEGTAPNPAVPGLTGRNLAYVLYTSGSTGRPKGVMIEHRGVLRLVINTSEAQIGPEDCVAHCASVSFDAATWEVWAPLLNGGQVCIVPQCVLLDPKKLNQSLLRNSVTAMLLTVALFHEYVDVLADGFRHLRCLLVGGDVLSPAAVARMFASHSQPQQVFNAYGPTETTVLATLFRIGALNGDQSAIPIGRPIANTRIHILDRNAQPVEVGQAGEIYIGGPGVARGYLNRPDLSAEKFVPDPFTAEAGAQLYRSGDLARWRADGNIEFLGRVDSQVKIRGFRVEPHEVEAALRGHPVVQQAAVMVFEHAPGEKRLAAYVVANASFLEEQRSGYADSEQSSGVCGDGNSVQRAQRRLEQRLIPMLREYLAKMLPPYMLPASISALERLPITVNGKVDTRRLPLPVSRPWMEKAYVKPHTLIEERLAAIWSKAFNLESIGVEDNFFELGGHSILGLRISGMTSEVFAVTIPASSLFQHPTVRQMGQLIERAHGGFEDDDPPMRQRDAHALIPVEDVQLTAWQTLLRNHAGLSERTCSTALHILGPLNVALLRDSVIGLIDRHESLRTRIVLIGGALLQQVDPSGKDVLTVVDLTGMPVEGSEREARRLSLEIAERPIDLSKGPLFEALLLQIASRSQILVLALDPMISDGLSVQIVIRDLWTIYTHKVRGLPIPLPIPLVQFGDYALWQKQTRALWVARNEAYWRKRLEDAPVTRLPADTHFTAISLGKGERFDCPFGSELSTNLRSLAAMEATLPSLLMLSVFVAIGARWCNQEDLVVQFVENGRFRAELEHMVGCLAHVLHLRVRVSKQDSFRDLLRHVTSEFHSACEHRDFNRVPALFPECATDLHVNWLPESWNPGTEGGLEQPSGPVTIEQFAQPFPVRSEVPAVRFLAFFCNDASELRLTVLYREDLFSRTAIERFCRDVKTRAEALVRDPACSVLG